MTNTFCYTVNSALGLATLLSGYLPNEHLQTKICSTTVVDRTCSSKYKNFCSSTSTEKYI